MSAQPAHPLLASTLFDLHNAKLARHQSNATNQITTDERLPSRKWRKLETGWKSIDGEVLQGGLAYGEGGIVCLSAGGSGANGGDGGVGELGDQVSVVSALDFLCFLCALRLCMRKTCLNMHAEALFVANV